MSGWSLKLEKRSRDWSGDGASTASLDWRQDLPSPDSLLEWLGEISGPQLPVCEGTMQEGRGEVDISGSEQLYPAGSEL